MTPVVTSHHRLWSCLWWCLSLEVLLWFLTLTWCFEIPKSFFSNLFTQIPKNRFVSFVMCFRKVSFRFNRPFRFSNGLPSDRKLTISDYKKSILNSPLHFIFEADGFDSKLNLTVFPKKYNYNWIIKSPTNRIFHFCRVYQNSRTRSIILRILLTVKTKQKA